MTMPKTTEIARNTTRPIIVHFQLMVLVESGVGVGPAMEVVGVTISAGSVCNGVEEGTNVISRSLVKTGEVFVGVCEMAVGAGGVHVGVFTAVDVGKAG